MQKTAQVPIPERHRQRAVVIAPLLLVGYILSVGPAAWFCQHGLLPGPIVEAVYAPLGRLGGSGKDSWLTWYLDFWKS